MIKCSSPHWTKQKTYNHPSFLNYSLFSASCSFTFHLLSICHFFLASAPHAPHASPLFPSLLSRPSVLQLWCLTPAQAHRLKLGWDDWRSCSLQLTTLVIPWEGSTCSALNPSLLLPHTAPPPSLFSICISFSVLLSSPFCSFFTHLIHPFLWWSFSLSDCVFLSVSVHIWVCLPPHPHRTSKGGCRET